MPTNVPKRRSIYGISCVKCSNKLIAPVKSEYRDGGHIRHMWLCPKCTHPLNHSNKYLSRI